VARSRVDEVDGDLPASRPDREAGRPRRWRRALPPTGTLQRSGQAPGDAEGEVRRGEVMRTLGPCVRRPPDRWDGQLGITSRSA
jgi:hypothetical protein